LGVSPHGCRGTVVVDVEPLLEGLLLLPQAETPTAIATANPTTTNLRIGDLRWGIP
jgi:hypothetical protein